MSVEENLSWWRDHHEPQRYLDVPSQRTAALVELIRGLDLGGGAILEIGCNAGRNLAGLWAAGYRRLHGIEISPAALRVFRNTYPECLEVKLSLGAVEEIIRLTAADSFGLVFTMATLLHLHPESEWVFAEMVRITSRWLLTVECENRNQRSKAGIQRHWARNYRTIFEGLGMRQTHEQAGFGDLDRYIARIFEKPA